MKEKQRTEVLFFAHIFIAFLLTNVQGLQGMSNELIMFTFEINQVHPSMKFDFNYSEKCKLLRHSSQTIFLSSIVWFRKKKDFQEEKNLKRILKESVSRIWRQQSPIWSSPTYETNIT